MRQVGSFQRFLTRARPMKVVAGFGNLSGDISHENDVHRRYRVCGIGGALGVLEPVVRGPRRARPRASSRPKPRPRPVAQPTPWCGPTSRSKIYHPSTSKVYGKTKRGAYMCEKEASRGRLPAAEDAKVEGEDESLNERAVAIRRAVAATNVMQISQRRKNMKRIVLAAALSLIASVAYAQSPPILQGAVNGEEARTARPRRASSPSARRMRRPLVTRRPPRRSSPARPRPASPRNASPTRSAPDRRFAGTTGLARDPAAPLRRCRRLFASSARAGADRRTSNFPLDN